ncbi:MAG: PEP-CTERM sorting domain-containing protein [Acetobacteraceae bacterium]|nr:PEP-CTERM sorting domain-containing protein [Acetobacteraceae bacterium]
MKRVLLTATACVALAAPYGTAKAALIDFTYTGTLVTFTVPSTDVYRILAFGAQGGGVLAPPFSGTGGLGAEIGGDFSLTAGEVLEVAVGGAGLTADLTRGAGGGGGGSFVVGPGNTPLVIAGGGGGAALSIYIPFLLNGGPGLTGPNGNGFGGAYGGIPAFDFFPGCKGGGGGGGFLGPGVGPGGGSGFPTLTGAGTGGFGGGGDAPGGGGGGYSGGAGGRSVGGGACQYGTEPGQGGGSFDAGANQILIGGVRSGDGEVLITELAVPEPASITLLGIAGIAGVSLRGRQRRRE